MEKRKAVFPSLLFAVCSGALFDPARASPYHSFLLVFLLLFLHISILPLLPQSFSPSHWSTANGSGSAPSLVENTPFRGNFQCRTRLSLLAPKAMTRAPKHHLLIQFCTVSHLQKVQHLSCHNEHQVS